MTHDVKGHPEQTAARTKHGLRNVTDNVFFLLSQANKLTSSSHGDHEGPLDGNSPPRQFGKSQSIRGEPFLGPQMYSRF